MQQRHAVGASVDSDARVEEQAMNMTHVMVCGVLAGFIVSDSPLSGTVAAQPAVPASQTIWENDRVQVQRVALAPGERLSVDSPAGSVIVFLTADLEGRMPRAEAAWHDPGPMTMENRGPARFEAFVVSLKGSAPRPGGVTAPEVVRASGALGPGSAGGYPTTARAQNLIVNDRISVTKEHSGSPWPIDPLHFHPQDSVVIYLRGGYVWPATSMYGPDRVRRGDVRVVPGNVLHMTGNAGSDPLEFLLILPA
jgi:mannose-6-phosphate isomerase-like protein (cupin superfamily)